MLRGQPGQSVSTGTGDLRATHSYFLTTFPPLPIQCSNAHPACRLVLLFLEASSLASTHGKLVVCVGGLDSCDSVVEGDSY